MTKDEIVYALEAVDTFCAVMKKEVLLHEEKGPWSSESTASNVAGVLKNITEVLDADSPLTSIAAATHAAMYCFFIVDNEAEKMMKFNDMENNLPGFAELLKGILARAEVDGTGQINPFSLIEELVKSGRIDIECE